MFDKLKHTYLPEDPLVRDPDGPPMSVLAVIALAIGIAFLLLVVPAMMPGNELDREIEALAESNWHVMMDNNCRVDMPHGKRVCESVGSLDGSTIRMEGY